MTAYKIQDFYESREEDALATYEAPSGRDALALYSIEQGFADPRDPDTFQDGQDWFHYDELLGVWTMTFTNTALVAIEVPS